MKGTVLRGIGVEGKRRKEADKFAELREVIGWQRRQMLLHNQLNNGKHAESSEAEIQALCKCVVAGLPKPGDSIFLSRLDKISDLKDLQAL